MLDIAALLLMDYPSFRNSGKIPETFIKYSQTPYAAASSKASASTSAPVQPDDGDVVMEEQYVILLS